MKVNIIHVGECAETMAAHLPDNSIDLTVTSPPYDNLRDYKGFTFDFPQIAAQLWRVTKPGGVVVWVVADATIDGSETGTSFRQALGFMELGFSMWDTMIYQKKGGMPTSPLRYTPQFEYMFILSKGVVKTANLIMVESAAVIRDGVNAKNTVRQRTAQGETTTSKQYGKPRNKKRAKYNVWQYNTGSSQSLARKKHPAIFPEALARDHIISWSNPGDIVLDPMCGSGTVPKMAVEQGRQYIGIDISAEYVELSRQRVAGARVPLPLPGLVVGGEAEQPEQLEFDSLGEVR